MATKKTITPAKGVKAKTKKTVQPKHIGLVKNDPYLEPYEDAIRGRHEHALWKLGQLTQNGKKTLSDFATTISGCTKQHVDGCSVSGLPMLLRYI